MELATLMASIRYLREQGHDRFALNSLVQIGTADEDFVIRWPMRPTRPARRGSCRFPNWRSGSACPRNSSRNCVWCPMVPGLRAAFDAARGMWYREFRLNATSAAISIHGSECGIAVALCT